MAINKPKHPKPIFEIRFQGWGLNKNGYDEPVIYLTAEELEKYNLDPDQYAADYYGITKEEYIQWILSEGTAKCAAILKSGELCKKVLKHQMDAKDWVKSHRSEYCGSHAEGN